MCWGSYYLMNFDKKKRQSDKIFSTLVSPPYFYALDNSLNKNRERGKGQQKSRLLE